MLPLFYHRRCGCTKQRDIKRAGRLDIHSWLRYHTPFFIIEYDYKEVPPKKYLFSGVVEAALKGSARLLDE